MTPSLPSAAEADAVAALLGFWSEAGVDLCFEDVAQDRIQQGKAALQRPVIPARPHLVLSSPAPAPILSSDAAASAEALVEARRAAASAETLDDLFAAIKAFDGCPLKTQGARQAVFARGDPAGGLMVIGEAPGADEDMQGAPFVGRAGQLLDRMLAAAGLKERAFITNTVFWRPPGNRQPAPAEQAVCAPFLERAISLAQPKLILLVGGAAAKHVLKRPEGITALRGQWQTFKPELGGAQVPALATFHPAFLLRQPMAKKQAWADLLALKIRFAALSAETE